MDRAEPHITTLMQHGLIARGHPLSRFGPDGDWGAESQETYDDYLAAIGAPTLPAPSRFPSDDIEALYSFYGRPDLGLGLAPRSRLMQFPYPMEISWQPGTWTSRTYAHERIHESLTGALSRILDHYGLDGIREHGLDQLGGVTNVRYMRGSHTRLSRHAFGVAIDLDPRRNGLRTPWPSKAKMPLKAIECFEAEGWTSFARARGIDAMHFQATRNFVGN